MGSCPSHTLNSTATSMQEPSVSMGLDLGESRCFSPAGVAHSVPGIPETSPTLRGNVPPLVPSQPSGPISQPVQAPNVDPITTPPPGVAQGTRILLGEVAGLSPFLLTPSMRRSFVPNTNPAVSLYCLGTISGFELTLDSSLHSVTPLTGSPSFPPPPWTAWAVSSAWNTAPPSLDPLGPQGLAQKAAPSVCPLLWPSR